MEALIFLFDIVCMLLLVVAIFRAERKNPTGDLGIFAYKADEENTAKERDGHA